MPERDHGKSDRKNCFLHELPYRGQSADGGDCFSSNEGLLGETPGAGELLERLREQEEKENRKE